MKLYNEFREFAVKGNMMDMAVGIMIGAAFSQVINSLVKDVMMPPILFMAGQVQLSDWQLTLLAPELNAQGTVVSPGIVLNFGQFIQHLISFAIIALVLFFLVKILNKLRRRAEDPVNTSVPTPKDIELLTEIRDVLARMRDEKSMTP